MTVKPKDAIVDWWTFIARMGMPPKEAADTLIEALHAVGLAVQPIRVRDIERAEKTQ